MLRERLLTNVGGFIVLGLGVNGWSVEECDSQYHKIARVAFQKSRGVLRRVQNLSTGSRYRSASITTALGSAFSRYKRLFGTATSTKVAIAATAANGLLAMVFSNYNYHQQPSNYGV
jgi:hypothetical protein